ncbi:ubiquinol-cytochrome c reductase iron-sulfur subunit [Propionibacteriaceae bacterium Y1923]
MTPDRRLFLTASLAAAAVGLAGCSGDNSSAPSINEPREPITIPVADVPSGGGVVLKGRGFVVTQPTDGDFKAFSAICPHQGCEVTNVADNEIICGCHGSRFNLSSGAVTRGPATTGLGAATVTRDGDTLTVTGS